MDEELSPHDRNTLLGEPDHNEVVWKREEEELERLRQTYFDLELEKRLQRLEPEQRLLGSTQDEMEDYWFPEPPLEAPQPSNEVPYHFLETYPKGSATLTYNDTNGNVISIHNLNLELIAEQSPIIAAAFEQSDRHSQLHLDLLSPLAALPFLRFLYTGSYDGHLYHDVPTSLLLHCQLYFFASVFDTPELKSQALINVLRQCEFACSSPDKPIDLCLALRFCYDHIEGNRRLLDEIIEYCIERFANHKLGEDQEFRSLAFGLQPFYSDLAKACRRRGFKDDSAIDIIRLPYNAQSPACYASMQDDTNPRVHDVVHHFHHSDDFEQRRQPRSKVEKPTSRQPSKQPDLTSELTLALRGAKDDTTPDADRPSSSEDEGFQIVRPVSVASSSDHISAGSDFIIVHRPAVGSEPRSSASSLSEMMAEAERAHAATARSVRTDDDEMSWGSGWMMARAQSAHAASARSARSDDDEMSWDSDWTMA